MSKIIVKNNKKIVDLLVNFSQKLSYSVFMILRSVQFIKSFKFYYTKNRKIKNKQF